MKHYQSGTKDILNGSVTDGFLYYNNAKKSEYEELKKEADDRLYMSWCAIFPNMTKENYISFEDYKKLAYSDNVDEEGNIIKSSERTEEEVINDARAIFSMEFVESKL